MAESRPMHSRAVASMTASRLTYSRGGSINGRLPMNETYDDSVLHDEVNNEEPPWVKGTFGVDWFFV